MPGGKCNIKPEDGKQFDVGNTAAEKWIEEEALRLGNDLINWMQEEDENVFFEDFIYLLQHNYAGKIYPEIIAYLSNKFSSFLKLIEHAKKIEEIKLKKFGAFDKLNGSIVKFLLSAQYGYTDKTNIDHTSKGDKINRVDNLFPPTDEIINDGTKDK